MSAYDIYQSPYSWRYASEPMRKIWSEAHKRRLWRQIWLALAEVQMAYGLVSTEQVADLREHVEHVDIQRALAIEAEIHHDLMAELKAYAEQCPVGGGILHLGATSTDIADNADVLRIAHSLELILDKLAELLRLFAVRIQRWAATPMLAYTHLQPAEPTTLGYRLAQYAQDLLEDREILRDVRGRIRGKGLKGAVGSGAALVALVGEEKASEMEARLMGQLGLAYYAVTTQVYPRKQDFVVVSALAGMGASLYKFAFDLRILQSPLSGELGEPFHAKQVGSSAMPFKRNPVGAEKIDSLARSLAQLPRIAWDNAAHSLLERTLDDSANRRSLLPESFLISDEILTTATRILHGLRLDEVAMARNLEVYGPFAAMERLLMALVEAGADRQAMHERLRQHAMAAWQAIQAGKGNPLVSRLSQDPEILRYPLQTDIPQLLQETGYFGFAADRARRFAVALLERLKP